MEEMRTFHGSLIHMENQDNQHKRRVRYNGTHPKHYKEKYKELNPDKYADTIAKVIDKGITPAGMHRSICVQEILDFLDITPGQKGFDATLGYGGHSLEMLRKLDHQGHLFATDEDPIELPKTVERLANEGFGPSDFTPFHMNFSNLDQIAKEVGPFDFLLADLGVSSMQIDNPDRGFSFKTEGPLDLRLNPEKGESAAQKINSMNQDEIMYMLMENADEPHAALIAKNIISARRKGRRILTTTDFRLLIEESLSQLKTPVSKEDIKKSCQRCFQALRIDVNSEYEVLYDLLEKIPHALAPGGKVAILTFHSGEDRLVKKSFLQGYRNGLYSQIAEEAIRPTPMECNQNARARSAKLRWAVR